MITTIATWTPLLIPAFILLDLLIRKRRYTTPRFWRTRALAMTIAIFFVTGEVAMFWANLFGDYHLFDLSSLGTWAGAVVGIVVYEFIITAITALCIHTTCCGAVLATRCITALKVWMHGAPTTCTHSMPRCLRRGPAWYLFHCSD